jgi:hypothetical protein
MNDGDSPLHGKTHRNDDEKGSPQRDDIDLRQFPQAPRDEQAFGRNDPAYGDEERGRERDRYNERDGNRGRDADSARDRDRDRDSDRERDGPDRRKYSGEDRGRDSGDRKDRNNERDRNKDFQRSRDRDGDRDRERGDDRDRQNTLTQRPNKQFNIELNKQVMSISDTTELCDFISTHAAEFNHVNVATAFRQVLKISPRGIPPKALGGSRFWFRVPFHLLFIYFSFNLNWTTKIK